MTVCSTITTGTTGPRYFHGSFARLSPGERLHPGYLLGEAVHFHSDHVYAVQLPETAGNCRAHHGDERRR